MEGKNYPKDPRFMVYTDGTLRGVRGNFMKPSLDKNGYRHVMIGRSVNEKVSRIVATTFVENPFNKKVVNHINGIKSDDRAENLEWCTHEENLDHASRTGLFKNASGSNHYLSKLDETQAKTIKVCIADGLTNRQLSEYFKVHPETIASIRKNKSWKHVR